MERIGRVRLVMDLEVHLDGQTIDFEEPPKDSDFEDDVKSLREEAEATLGCYGEVLSVAVEVLERPPTLAEVAVVSSWKSVKVSTLAMRTPAGWVAERDAVRKQLPMSWQFDLDMDTLAPDGEHSELWQVTYRGGIRVPLILRDGFWTLGLCKEIEDEVRRCFPAKAEEILPTIRYGRDHWSFSLCGMYVGVDITNAGEVLVHS